MQRKTQEDFIRDAKSIHGDKYDYSSTVYLHRRGNIKIICKIHGVFTQIASKHLAGHGCQICAKEFRKLKAFNKYSPVFISKAIAIHGDTYDYSQVVYKTVRTHILVICKKHGVFSTTPNKHLSGGGCPSCKISHGESMIETILNSSNIVFYREKTFRDCKVIMRMKFDFYIPSYNTLIEYQGEQHFHAVIFFGGLKSFMNLKRNDEYKKRWAIENGFIFKEYTYRDSWEFIKRDLKVFLR